MEEDTMAAILEHSEEPLDSMKLGLEKQTDMAHYSNSKTQWKFTELSYGRIGTRIIIQLIRSA
jgi:hypothetical protein